MEIRRLRMTRVIHASLYVLLAGFNLDTVENFVGHSEPGQSLSLE